MYNKSTPVFDILEKPIAITEQNWEEDVKPLVSISCTTFNHEKHIRDAIEGFLNQKTTFPVEINIHDDASTDDTASIIREYEVKYPQILFNPIYQTENQFSKRDGTIGRIQKGRAIGKYYAMCEGDDYWTDPLKLQKQVEFLEENNSYAGAGCYNESFVYNGDTIDHKKTPAELQFKRYSLVDFLMTGTPGLRTCNMMYRNNTVFRNMLKENIFESKANGDRIILTYMLKNAGDIALLPFTGSVYRIHSKGASSGLSGLGIRNEVRRNYEGVMKKILTEDDEKYLLWKKNLKRTWKRDLVNLRINNFINDYRIYRNAL